MNRSREGLIECILELCIEPTNKTRIVYQCNLTFQRVDSHLDHLVNVDCLEVSKSPSKILYKTTTKGLEALEHIKALNDMLRPVD